MFVGFNTATPVQLYSMTGTYLQDVGPADAIAAIPTTSNYFFVEPNNRDVTSSTIAQYNASLNQIGSFTMNDLIDDGAAGAVGTLWLSSYNGTIYQVSNTGAVSTSWSTGYLHDGVAFDGTYVYTTEGDAGSDIEKWSINGVLVGQIATPTSGLYGLGYDTGTGNFWAGSTDFIYQFDANGNLLTTLDLLGDGRTPSGAVHDSINVGQLLTPTSTVPEPTSPHLFGVGLLLLGGMGAVRRKMLKVGLSGLAMVSSAGVLLASVSVNLTPSSNNAQIGTTVLWTASAADTENPNATLIYQFSVGTSAAQLQVKRDFFGTNTFPWTPSDSEGVYTVQVVVNSSTGASATSTASYTVTSRITGATPVVSQTSHPLVALYSLPPCPAGHTARVRFKTAGDTVWQATSLKKCTGTASLNFYIAGMRSSTTYTVQQDVYNGPFDTLGPLLTFTTGAVPSGLGIPNYDVSQTGFLPNATAYPVVLTSPAGRENTFATDTQGHLIWYLPVFTSPVNNGYMTRPVVGGTFLGVYDDNSGFGNLRILDEWDLVGNVVRETNVDAVSKQLLAFGTDPVRAFTHEAFRFTNGDTGVIATVEKVADQGSGPVDVFGDMAIVLDSNLQVKWWWNEFEHLDIKRQAILGETCSSGVDGCIPLSNPGYAVA
ncbi:MAG: aryl-sulfate sulfotransferase, partial [Acidobacteriota bacterium]|nr:aryl-sulfate sulfotransferase [Acidobacteriota bacterium]